jgi:hypothetical protein
MYSMKIGINKKIESFILLYFNVLVVRLKIGIYQNNVISVPKYLT